MTNVFFAKNLLKKIKMSNNIHIYDHNIIVDPRFFTCCVLTGIMSNIVPPDCGNILEILSQYVEYLLG